MDQPQADPELADPTSLPRVQQDPLGSAPTFRQIGQPACHDACKSVNLTTHRWRPAWAWAKVESGEGMKLTGGVTGNNEPHTHDVVAAGIPNKLTINCAVADRP